uniref:ubiquitinyl hydrolase 1 n=1 Tax=Monopterus albus TaxID=43700 RepID=A0A3Q3J1L5_MONAL
MSGAPEQIRKRRPPKMFLISTDMKIQDQLEGTIRLHRGYICQEQDMGKNRGDSPWVKVLDNGVMIRIETKFLLEVPSALSGLLEPVSDPETRLILLDNPGKLQQFAALPIGALLWVQIGQQDELAEAELKYIGTLSRGSTAVYFGIELKTLAAAFPSEGSGDQKRSCPEACALFLPVSHIRLRRWSRSSGSNAHERDHHHSSNNHPSDGHHSNNNSPVSPLPFHVGQRVCFPLENTICGGEVRFCGPLSGHPSLGMYVGVLLDSAVGNWNGYYRGEKLCHIPSPIYGLLLPVTKVYSEPKSQNRSPHQQMPKSILKPAPPPAVKPDPPAPKVSLMPPNKQPLKPPPLPPPKIIQKPLPLPPLPPPKPTSPMSPTAAEQLQHTNGVHTPPSPLTSPDNSEAVRENGKAGLEGKLEVGSMVEVNDPPLFGVIRWIGQVGGISEPMAGIELDQQLLTGTDGSYFGERHFSCPANKGLFVRLRNCRRDSRFPAPETPVNQVERCNSIAFAEWGSERVEEHTPPVDGDEAKELYQGWKRGIQGHLNSCYLDATLFSLFSCCSSADWVLFWPPDSETKQSYSQAQDLLRCEIVNPLRRYGYVCASKTMSLRRLLEAANSDTGFTNQEKDPEEFLNKLFQLLRVEPLLKIRSMTQQPQACHLYQLFPPTLPPSPSSPLSHSPVDSPIPLSSPSSNRLRVASVQALLESSFFHAGLKFVEAPSCLLLLMPRFGKDFKMFDAILPTLSLDITDLLDDTPRQCSICQTVAEWECVQCYEDLDITPGRLKQYCQTCNTQVHSHRKRVSHSPVKIGVPVPPWTGPLHCTRQRMSLFAVTCIETSHYVSFVKHGPHPTDWLFFDSMADREGGENGFNIPQVKACPEVGRYLSLSEEELSRVDPASLREPARRLLCDSYMCLYHSPELSLYK